VPPPSRHARRPCAGPTTARPHRVATPRRRPGAGQAAAPPDQPHPVEHAGIGRVGEQDLVPGIGQAEQGVQHRIALATSDHDLPAPVIARPPATLDVGATASLRSSRPVNGSQLFASSSPIAARVAAIAASGGAMSVSRFSSRRGDPINVEAPNVLQTPDAHRSLPLAWLRRRGDGCGRLAVEIRAVQWRAARVSLPARARTCSASSGGSSISNSVPMMAT